MRPYLKRRFWKSLRFPCKLFAFLLWEVIKMAAVAILCIGIAKAIFFLLDEPDPLTSEAMTRAMSKFENSLVSRRSEEEKEKQVSNLSDRTRRDSMSTPADEAGTVAEELS